MSHKVNLPGLRNGFSINIPNGEVWDGTTYGAVFDGVTYPSNVSGGTYAVPVVGIGTQYPIGMSYSNLVKLYWRVKSMTSTIAPFSGGFFDGNDGPPTFTPYGPPPGMPVTFTFTSIADEVFLILSKHIDVSNIWGNPANPSYTPFALAGTYIVTIRVFAPGGISLDFAIQAGGLYYIPFAVEFTDGTFLTGRTYSTNGITQTPTITFDSSLCSFDVSLVDDNGVNVSCVTQPSEYWTYGGLYDSSSGARL